MLTELSTGFDLKALRAFVQVAESGGMTAAASRLGMTQSSVSQLIANLETAVGCSLFDRNVRPIALTSSGMVLYDRSRSILAQVGDAFQVVRDQERRQLPSLTIGMADSLANTLGGLLVRDQQQLAERWRIWAGISASSHREFLDHSADMVITVGSELDIVEGLEIHRIVAEPYLLVIPQSYDIKPTWEALSDKPFIRYSLRSSTGQQIEQQISRLRLKLPVRIEFDSTHGQLQAVADGLGWSITTPLCLLQDLSFLSKVKVAPISKGQFYRTVRVIAREGNLGALSKQIATTTRKLIKQQCLPRLYSQLPWLEQHVEWLEH